jgi:hypothetical protein
VQTANNSINQGFTLFLLKSFADDVIRVDGRFEVVGAKIKIGTMAPSSSSSDAPE